MTKFTFTEMKKRIYKITTDDLLVVIGIESYDKHLQVKLKLT